MTTSDGEIREILEGLSRDYSIEQLKTDCQLLKDLEPVLEFEDRILAVYLAGALELKVLRGTPKEQEPSAQVH